MHFLSLLTYISQIQFSYGIIPYQIYKNSFRRVDVFNTWDVLSHGSMLSISSVLNSMYFLGDN